MVNEYKWTPEMRAEFVARVSKELQRPFDYASLSEGRNPMLRKVAGSHRRSGTQSVGNKPSSNIGTHHNPCNGAARLIAPARGVAVPGTGVPAGA